MAQVTYTIPNALLSEFKLGFLKAKPVPIYEGEPIMSENAWIWECGKEYFLEKYKKGKKELALETTEIVEGLIE